MTGLSGTTLGKAAAVIAAGVAAAAAAFVITDGVAAPVPGAKAWFDEPLDGAYYEHGPVRVVAHAAHPEGVVDVAVSANGEEVTVVNAGGDRLVEVTFDWEPPGDGVFALHVVGRDNDGDQTTPDVVTVGVGVEPTADGTEQLADGATTTTEPALGEESTTSTSSENAGIPPAEDPTDPAAPGGGAPGAPPRSGGGTPTPPPPPAPPCPNTPDQLSTIVQRLAQAPRLQWHYLGCAVDQFEAEASTTPTFVQSPDNHHLQGLVPGGQSYWDVPPSNPMHTCTTYYWHVRARLGRDLGAWSATQTYQTPCR
jgi:hypothetical protein